MRGLIVNLIEDMILVYFVSEYTKLSKKHIFNVTVGTICFIETTIFDFYPDLSVILPISISITLLIGIKYFDGKIELNSILACLLGPVLVIISNILALVIVCSYLLISINLIGQNACYLQISIVISKLLLLIIVRGVIYLSSKAKSILFLKDWWMLFPIWLMIIFILYIAGEAIVYNKVTMNTIYFNTIFTLLLTIFSLILLYKIQIENEKKRVHQLEQQKSYYMKKNMEMINKLHNEITVIEHSTVYILLHIKALIENKKFIELNNFLEKNILKARKYRNIINTSNPYFDHELNKKINSLILQGANIKSSVFIQSNQLNIDKTHLDIMTLLIEYIFSISINEQVLSLDIYQQSNYMVMSIAYFIKDNIKIDIPYEISVLCNYVNADYSSNKVGEMNVFKLVFELGI